MNWKYIMPFFCLVQLLLPKYMIYYKTPLFSKTLTNVGPGSVLESHFDRYLHSMYLLFFFKYHTATSLEDKCLLQCLLQI